MKMNKLLFALALAPVALWSCSDDDPAPTFDAPTIAASAAEVRLATGETAEITTTLTVPAGIAQYSATNSDDAVATLAADVTPEVGDTEVVVTWTVTAVAPGTTVATVSVLDAAGESVEAIINIGVVKGLGEEFASLYEFVTLRPEFSDYKYMWDQVGLADVYDNQVPAGNVEGVGDYFYDRAALLFQDGWLDEWIAETPLYASREDVPAAVWSQIANIHEQRFEDRNASRPYGRFNHPWAAFTDPDNATNPVTGQAGNYRRKGQFNALRGYLSGLGYDGTTNTIVDPGGTTVATPIVEGEENGLDIEASVLTFDGNTFPHVYIHAFDQFPMDFSAAFADPQGVIADQLGGSFQDASIVQNLFLTHPDVKWTMNAVDPSVGGYAGSRGMYGALIFPATVFDDLNDLIVPIDANYELGNTATRVRTCCGGSEANYWVWDGGATHIDDAGVYGPVSNFWYEHLIPTETVENGPLADGTYTNGMGNNVELSGTTVTANGNTVNVVWRARIFQTRIDWGNISPAPSQQYQDDTNANGGFWLEVIVTDGSIN